MNTAHTMEVGRYISYIQHLYMTSMRSTSESTAPNYKIILIWFYTIHKGALAVLKYAHTNKLIYCSVMLGKTSRPEYHKTQTQRGFRSYAVALTNPPCESEGCTIPARKPLLSEPFIILRGKNGWYDHGYIPNPLLSAISCNVAH